MASSTYRNPRTAPRRGEGAWQSAVARVWWLAVIVSGGLLAGCGGSSSSGGGSGTNSGSGGVGSQGHTIRVRPEVVSLSDNIHGRTVSGEIFVTLEPATGVDDVVFWLDDPLGLGEPYQVEGNPPFDFNGGTSTDPTIWDTTEIPDGPHEITAEILYADGTTEMLSASFTVSNSTPSITTNKTSVSFSFAADEVGSASSTAQLGLSTGGSAPYVLSYTPASWLLVTQSSTTLPTTLTFAVNSSSVPVGQHQVPVTVSSAGFASAQVTVTLTITPGAPPPPTPTLVFGAQLIRHDYFLDSPGSNSSTVSLSATDGTSAPFTLSYPSVPWMTVTPNSGTIPASIQVSVSSIGLPAGIHETTITASVAGYADAQVDVRVTVISGSASLASSVSQHGFTWNFDGEYEVGQFVNGDYYVVGPVLITSMSPSWTGTYDGSMINPVWDTEHGYDSRWNFSSSLRANTNNLLLQPGQSLVSVDSWRDNEPGSPPVGGTSGIPVPALKTAAVLTCLASHPPAGSFRPPYGGTSKPLHNVSDLRPWLLPQLAPPSNTPSLSSVEGWFDRVWLDHLDGWMGRALHPEDNMQDYGRDFTSEYNTGSLMLMLNFTDAQKETLMIRLVQIGIDMFAIIQSGAEWGNDGGGHGGGRKWPILLAGILLDDPAMMNVANISDLESFQEDCQTFYLTSSQASQYPDDSVGDPVWGERHCYLPGTDPGTTSYRTCCTANAWVGAVLSVHILSGETTIDVYDLWDHDALFDYQDRYMAEETPGSWKRSWSAFQESMWDAYRADYAPVWTP